MALLLHQCNKVYVWFGDIGFGLAWFINVLIISEINYLNLAHIIGYFRTKASYKIFSLSLPRFKPWLVLGVMPQGPSGT